MVSVIIPTYNRSRTIERAIRSVLIQTYTDLEVIVVDDCSTDNTADIVHCIKDDRVKYFRLECNQGACVARNVGIDMAKGDYIAFQDSDDEWMAEKLEKVLSVMEETQSDICFHRLKRFYPKDNRCVYFPSLSENTFLSHEEMSVATLISTQTIVARRSVFAIHRFDPLVKKTQDYFNYRQNPKI